MKKVFKYATGDTVPEDAVYLCSKKNGIMLFGILGVLMSAFRRVGDY